MDSKQALRPTRQRNIDRSMYFSFYGKVAKAESECKKQGIPKNDMRFCIISKLIDMGVNLHGIDKAYYHSEVRRRAK